jgi:hypothetical protein
MFNTLPTGTPDGAALCRSLVLDDSNRLWAFAWVSAEGGVNKLVVRYSEDYGINWSNTADIDIDSSNLDHTHGLWCCCDENGYIHCVYTKKAGTYANIYYVTRNESGWSSPLKISTSSGSANKQYPTVTVNGAKIFCFYGKVNTSSDIDLWMAEYDGSWSDTEIINDGAANGYAQVSVDSSDNICILESKSNKIYYKQRSGGVWGAITEIDSGNYGFGTICVKSDTFYIYCRCLNSSVYKLAEYKKAIGDVSWTQSYVDTNATTGIPCAAVVNNTIAVFYNSATKCKSALYTSSWTLSDISAHTTSVPQMAAGPNFNTGQMVICENDSGTMSIYTNKEIKAVADTGNLVETENINKSIVLAEIGDLEEGLVVPIFVDYSLYFDETFHGRIDARKSETFDVEDSETHYQLIHPKDSVYFSELISSLTYCPYVRWILNEPLNINFAFEDGSDNYTLMGSVTDERYSEDFHSHCLKLLFSTQSAQVTGVFTCEVDTTDYHDQALRLWTNFKIINDDNEEKYFKIEIWNNLETVKFDEFDSRLVSRGWNYWNTSFNIGTTDGLIIKVYSDDCEVVLDNFAIVPIYPVRNPESLTVPYENKEGKEQTLMGKTKTPRINYYQGTKVSLPWSLLKYNDRNYIKSLVGKKILLRTHNMVALAVRVTGVTLDVPVGFEQTTQLYDTKLECYVY